MKFYWRKLGLLYFPSTKNRHPKLATHAANPIPILLEGNIYRILFSGRDSKNRSSIGAVDVDLKKLRIIREFNEPLFIHGEYETFYCDGISLGNVYEVGAVRYILFMGWQNPPSAHWRGDIGRIRLAENWKLYLEPEEPVLTVSSFDPVSVSYPWVHYEEPQYHMWYGSTITWDAGNGEMLHVINYAYSDDGHRWQPKGVAVPYEIGKAQAFSRPTVIKINSVFHMWFSYRSGSGEKYRIGYAYSYDGYDWQLDLTASGITPSETGWDSEMIEYPYVFQHDKDYFMLYNGNGYGRSGFGIAVLEEIEC